MVMSTTEQGAFETALVTPASLDSIKAVEGGRAAGACMGTWGRYIPY